MNGRNNSQTSATCSAADHHQMQMQQPPLKQTSLQAVDNGYIQHELLDCRSPHVAQAAVAPGAMAASPGAAAARTSRANDVGQTSLKGSKTTTPVRRQSGPPCVRSRLTEQETQILLTNLHDCRTSVT
jgi:hypothetical protein